MADPWDLGAGRKSGPGSTNKGMAFLGQVKDEFVAVLLGSKMNVLLLLTPFAFAAAGAHWSSGVTFVLALLPLCSLAERLGMITEQLALYTNDTLGGLLNATFGNATEVIIAAFAIQKNLLRVVKLTLLGSIISNLLLVMGSAFIAGGVLHPLQHFSQHGISANCGLLILSVIAIMLPTLLSSTSATVKDDTAELALSRFESCFMLLCYGLFLLFQLYTHRWLYDEKAPQPQQQQAAGMSRAPSAPGGLAPAAAASNGNGASTLGNSGLGHSSSSIKRQGANGGQQYGKGAQLELVERVSLLSHGEDNGMIPAGGVSPEAMEDGSDTAQLLSSGNLKFEPEDEEEEKELSLVGCFLWLTIVTILISFLSDIIMDCITDASKQLHVPMPFLTTIIVPIVGNAAEHASALIFAARNRMEISLGVALGSSTQVGVLVVPFCVVLAWGMGRPLDLNFNEFEALVLFVSVLLATMMVIDGTSHWLKGALLVITYVFVSAGFWVHKDPLLVQDVDGDLPAPSG